MSNKLLEENYIPFQCMIIAYVNTFKIEGVATAQYELLNILLKAGAKTTKELAEKRGISQSGISKLTKRLLEKGYIAQERSIIDRRSYNIFITEAGKNFLGRAETLRNEIMSTIEHALSEEEIQNFSRLCKKIVSSCSIE